MTTRITINGQTYGSVEEMPPDIRRQYESAMGMLADKDGNGIPDILEGKGALPKLEGGLLKQSVVSNVTSRIVINGKEYSNWDDVPAAIRQSIEKAGVALHGKPGHESSAPDAPRASLPMSSDAGLYPTNGGVRIGLVWLVVLLLVAILVGMLIGVKLLR